MARRNDKIDEKFLPDGGWGWMVVFGVAITNTFNQSLVSVFGLLFGEHLESMGYGTSGISLVANMNNMVMSFSGLLIGPLLRRYSCRTVTLVGSLITSVGLIMSSFSDTLEELLFFYSFLAGIGLGLIYPATFVMIKTYFSSRRRGLAVGISMAGTGLGQMLMPQVVSILLQEFGFTGATRIIGALCLHGVAGALLFQPVHWHLKEYDGNLLKNLVQPETKKTLSEIKIVPGKELENGKLNGYSSLESTAKIEEEIESKPWWKKLSDQLDLKLLLDPSFVNICAGLGLTYTANMSFGMIFPFYLLETLRFSRSDTALCMSLLSGFDIVARVTVPSISRALHISNRDTYMVGALLLALARTAIAEVRTHYFMMGISLVCGYVRAITVINQNLSVSDHCNDQELPAALGLTMVSKGIFVITVGQFLGWLRDYTESYSLFIHATNILLLLVFLTWFIELLMKKFHKK